MPSSRSRLVNGKLPYGSQGALIFLFGLPLVFATTKFLSLPNASSELSSLLCTFVLTCLIASIVFAGLSCILPDFVHSNMTPVRFLLWLLLNVGLICAAHNFSRTKVFTLSVASVLLVLFILVLFHYQKHIWRNLDMCSDEKKQREIFECGADLLIAKTSVIIVLTVSIIGFIVIPVIGWNAKSENSENIDLVFITTSILHILAFFIWFFVTLLASATLDEAP